MINPYGEALIRLFYPAECERCRRMLPLDEKIFCANCQQNLNLLAWPLEKVLVEDRFEFLDYAWAVFAYESPLKELLYAIKYHHQDYLFEVFKKPAISLAQAVTSDTWYDAVLPIPIHGLKFLKRHFNQSEILAKMLAPWITPPVRTRFLIKKHFIPSQTYLDRKERKINIYGAFKLRQPPKVRGGSFLLVDDVLTTGSTANEAARLLKLHGARRVDLLALARTVTNEEKKTLCEPQKNVHIPLQTVIPQAIPMRFVTASDRPSETIFARTFGCTRRTGS